MRGRRAEEPSLYLSLYLKSNRARYYELLQDVRTRGNWEEWIEFFLLGVEETATQAVEAARQIIALLSGDRAKIDQSGRAAASAGLLFQLLQRRPIISIAAASSSLGISKPTAAKSIETLIQLGIITEVTGKQKRRLFAYARYIEILGMGTEPLPR